MKYPITQLEFEKMFSTEEHCIDYLIEIRFPEGFKCEKCDHTSYWMNCRNLLVCKKCRNDLSITSGTIFHKSKLSLPVLFRVLWWIIAQKNGVSAKGVQRILGIGSYKTAWVWLQKFRRLMVVPSRDKLSGEIEIDETYIGGKRSGKRGRGAEGKTLVAIAVEVKDISTGRVRLKSIPDASSKSLNGFIKENVAPGSTIITDDWRGYKRINPKIFQHDIELQKKKDDDGEMLPNVHRVASLLKRWLVGTHQNFATPEYLDYYLDEYTFRYNRRKLKKAEGCYFTG